MAIQNERQRPSVIADELISVTIDASELTVASAEPLRNVISRYGRPVSARAFADFQQPALADLSVQFYQMGVSLVHCPTWPNGDGVPKPIVSDVVAQDLRDQLEELEDVETFLLVATSRDYIAVANAVRRHERRVVVVAEEAKVCRELRLCADEFVALPPTKPERSLAPSRVARSTEVSRGARAVPVRAERPAELPRVERVVETPRVERVVETPRVERVVETPRVERVVETPRVERSAEPVRVEKPVEAVRPEPQEQLRLPSDAEVLAEVRKIVAAEGICTPRRLARALCPVDRTPTGELRSRIANRIQSLVDAGKLIRERLVVGGTSVETILVREEKEGKEVPATAPEVTSPVPPAATISSVVPAVPSTSTAPASSNKEDALPGIYELVSSPDPTTKGNEVEVEAPAEPESAGSQRPETPAIQDLDAFVESVLRGQSRPASKRSRNTEQKAKSKAESKPEQTPEPEAEASTAAAEVASETPDAASETAEQPKRTRSRKRATPKVAVPEPNGAA